MMKPPISLQELAKIEQLLDSPNPVNIELGLTILSGFAIEEKGAIWLYDYYKKLFIQEQQPNQAALQKIVIGTIDSKPSKASHILTLLFKKASQKIQFQILQGFLHQNTLTLPRTELKTFPDSIYQLSNIKTLIAQYGQINMIMADISRFQQLEVLDLAHQPLAYIHPNLTKLQNLKTLVIRNAAILSDDILDMSHVDIMIEGAY